ncbi:ABC transporter substrate binding protein [Rhabdochromatium marinum]|uniref:ABC transporter substrate binding protein n=1 Tax=Rhabdochromatium marinum TaxID=48729 RepID=UPI001904D02B|nr:ABC transporter substrate binding protein [Rhabdochromatium marinum]
MPTGASGVPKADARILAEDEDIISSVGKQRVLVLNSYNIGYAWTDNEVRAIQDVFANNPDVVLHLEFMDTKLSNSAGHFANLARLLRRKFRDVSFDVIIATDDDALDFLRDYGAELFAEVPIVFAGINNFKLSKIQGLTKVTGVNEEADFHDNIELIARLIPEVKHIYVIADNLTAGRMIRREFDRAAQDFQSRFRFHYFTGLDMAELSAKLTQLSDDSVVFYLTFFQDAAGHHFAPQEAIPLISNSSPVPVFGQVDYMIGEGVLGGKVKSAYYQGRVVAQIAQRILNGEKAECIPIIMDSPNSFMFDYEQLRRFHINFSELPQDSIILNQPETFFYKYRTLIGIVLSVFVVLIGFILILLFNIRQRKRAQQGLQDILVAMGSVLELHSAAEIKEKLISIINRIIFLEQRIDCVAVYNYTGPLHHYKPQELIPLTTTQPADSGSAADDSLIRRAVEKGGSLVSGNQCVALFRTRGLVGNLVHLSGRRRFEDIDQDLLEILTSNVSMAIEQLEKSKLQESLETARQIQLSMLPHAFSTVTGPFGIDLHAHLLPAKEVGGDLYDFFAIDETHLCIAVGDVADKGIPAALFMAVAKTLIRAKAEPGLGPEIILNKVNAELVRDNEQCLFVTLFLGIFEPTNGLLHYVNAGHNPPYHIDRNGQPVALTGRSGPALGVIEGATYRPHQLHLQPGETLFIYTDGVTEAADASQQLYGEERLEQLLSSLNGASAEVIDTTLMDRLHQFAQGASQADDITVLTMRVTEPSL